MTIDVQLPTWTLGERMAKARRAAGLDTDDLAAYLGCSERTIRNYERGATRPNRPTLMAWAHQTRVPLWWLDGDTPDTPEAGVTIGQPTRLALVA